ncbi:MAG: dihydrofolate reductase family protein [Chloroflexi bacterium]|nr:dihydrofolate reductase family protein [Chloroflexota bacterium]
MSRPKVVVLNSASVDGRVAVSRDALLLYGDKRWKSIEGPGGVSLLEWLKLVHQPQATLEGSGSFVRDDETPPSLPLFEGDSKWLYQDFLPERILHRPGHRGWFAAVDGRGRIRWAYKEFPDEAWKGWYALVLAAHRTPPEYLAYLQREEIPYFIAGQERVDLGRALEKMESELGVHCILSTAGGRLNGALLRAGLVDEINLEFLPGVIGGFDTPSLFDSPELKADEMPTRLRLISAQAQADGRVWLRYEVVRAAEEGGD